MARKEEGKGETRFPKQNFDYFLVLDFEANGDHKIIKPMEIIEFPVLKISGKTFETEAIFHQYVEPTVNKQICEYCIQVTGITQSMLNGQPTLDETLKRLDSWMKRNGLLDDGVTFTFVTCGDWDLKTQLPRETEWHGLQLPSYCRSWINIKKPFQEMTKLRAHGMMGMLKDLDIQHTGRHHSGIDDCKNIAKILKKLASQGFGAMARKEEGKGETRFPKQNFDYFLVLDFEANGDHKIIKPMEIIEFPVLKISGKTFETEAIFHQYVEPTVNKQICEYCIQVTGITQSMLNGQPTLDETLKRLDSWMKRNGLLDDGVTFAFVTCGDWDLKTQLPRETEWHGWQLPSYCRSWINIKKPFQEMTKLKAHGMMGMLKDLGIQHTGRHHSGIDDCKNIAKILKKLASQGYVYSVTGTC